jgi:phosphoglycolate phosphatase-like HAD superfamily hydrolase
MRDLHGVEEACTGLRFAGATDRSLVRTILERAGLPSDEGAIAEVLARYVRHLESFVLSRHYRALGDVASAVGALRGRGMVVGIATGNVRDGARLKLTSAGLLPHFDLDLGGFGCDAELRADIVRIAAERCCKTDGKSGRTVIVVGDTEHDVSAARALGARVVGVASRAGARAELETAGADVVVPECGDELVSALITL